MTNQIKIDVYEYIRTKKIRELEAFKNVRYFDVTINFVGQSSQRHSTVSPNQVENYIKNAIASKKGFDFYAFPRS